LGRNFITLRTEGLRLEKTQRSHRLMNKQCCLFAPTTNLQQNPTTMSLRIRLKKARNRKGLTQQRLAEMVGVKQQAIQRIEAGKAKSTTFLVQIARALEVSPDWLASGPGDEPIPAHAEVRESNTHYSSEFPTVPLLEWSELPKMAEIIAQENNPDRKRIPCLIPNTNKAFAVRVPDDSMCSEKTKISFMRDDILIMDPNKQAHDGSYVLAKLPQIVFRKYIGGSNGGHLEALNTRHESLHCEPHVKIFATLVERISVHG